MDFLTGVLFGNHSLNKCLIAPFQNCLQMDPTMRLDCAELLDHAYFDRYRISRMQKKTFIFSFRDELEIMSKSTESFARKPRRPRNGRPVPGAYNNGNHYSNHVLSFPVSGSHFLLRFFKSTDSNYFHRNSKLKRKAANMIGNEWARVKWSRVTIKQQN